MKSQSQRLARAAARVLPAVLIAALAAAPAALAAPSDEGREEFTRAFQKTLPLKAGQRLSIEHRNGDIRVRTHAESKVSIDAKIRVSSSDKAGAAKFAEGIQIIAEPAGDGVSVRTVYPDKSWHFEGKGYISYSVEIGRASCRERV